MPYNEFICPDKNTCEINQCLTKCRLADRFPAQRCLSLPTLKAIANQREWTGTPSTTQLLNGTREAYLRIVKDFPIDPQDMMWALFGTGLHAAIEAYTGEDDIAEKRIFGDYSSGSPDYYETETGFLFDRKSYGSYKTAKVLGLSKKRIPVFDENGVQKKYKNGKLVFNEIYVIGHRSRFDVSVQLNDYRMKLEQEGYKVNKMFIEILTRDSGTYIAEQRGIHKNAQLVEVNKISDHWIETYMKTKAARLINALETNELPPICNYLETWGHLKCKRYCQVWQHCDYGIHIRKG